MPAEQLSGNDGVGGLVGENNDASNLINSYASGAVSGNWYVGGLGWREQRR